MTEKLYYTDSTLRSFEATILSAGATDDGRKYVVLDRTAFYPTSGGQPHDLGKLNGVEVTNVQLDNSGDIRHIVGDKFGSAGEKVAGTIDWTRRRQNCQNHTAQHILSSVFHNNYQIETVSVHLGQEYCAVEFKVDSISDEMLAESERRSNEIIADNLPIEIMFVDEADHDKIPLRRPTKRSGRIRVIKVGDDEYSACGGTHCSSTGGVGQIKIVGVENIRGRVRVKFLAGLTAVNDYGLRFQVSDGLSKQLTCHPGELAERFNSLQEQYRELKGRLLETQKANLPNEIDNLSSQAIEFHGSKVVIASADGLDQSLVTQFAQQLASRLEGLAVVMNSNRITLATSETSSLSAKAITQQLTERTEFKGGGTDRLANLGGGKPLTTDELRTLIEEILGEG